jgi:uncharacterized membrane protein
MKEKIKEIQQRIESDPKLKEAVEKIKPKKNIWGILGIILFFFLPEMITYIWQNELIHWAHMHSISEASSALRMLYGQLEEMFISGVSWLNISIGVLLLLWVWRSK